MPYIASMLVSDVESCGGRAVAAWLVLAWAALVLEGRHAGRRRHTAASVARVPWHSLLWSVQFIIFMTSLFTLQATSAKVNLVASVIDFFVCSSLFSLTNSDNLLLWMLAIMHS